MAEKTTTDTPLGVQYLTDEERQALEEMSPAMLEHAESGSLTAQRALSGWLKSHRARNKNTQEVAQAQAQEIRQLVAQGTPKTQQGCFATWMGYPTDMTRCSPFFPMNVRNLGKRDFLQNFVITSSGWGEILYTGPRLSTYEEDVLMVLLAIVETQNEHKEITDSEGRKTYTYRGPALPLLRLLGHEKPGKNEYRRLMHSLELMTVAGVKICISGGKTKKGKQREPKRTSMSSLLSNASWNEEKKELSATVNQFFYETHIAGTVTLYDVLKRIEINGVIAKSLYRFVQSHRKNPVFKGHYLTLADALNMDRDQPGKATRRQLKTAISELIRHGILTNKSKFIAQDIVILDRAEGSLPAPKKSTKKVK